MAHTPRYPLPAGRPARLTCSEALDLASTNYDWTPSVSMVAGYLGYSLVKDFRIDLRRGEPLAEICHRYTNLNKNNFDIVSKSKVKVNITGEKLVNMAWNWTSIPEAALDEINRGCFTDAKPGPSDQVEGFERQSKSRHYYCALAAMASIIRQCSRLNKQIPNSEKCALLGFHIEDWSRAWALLNHYKNRIGKGQGYEDLGSTQWNKKLNMPPLKSTGGMRQPKKGRVEAGSAVHVRAEELMDNEWRKRAGLFISSEGDKANADIQDVEKGLDQLNLPARSSERSRPSAILTPDKTKIILRDIAEQVNWYQHPAPVLNPADFTGYRAFDAAAHLASNLVNEGMREAATLEAAFQNSEEQDEGMQACDLTFAAHGMRAPSFLASFAFLSAFLPVNMESDYLVQLGGFKFHPHQVTGAVWSLLRLRSSLKGGLLADEMGLGKTMTSLLALLLYAKVQHTEMLAVGKEPESLRRLASVNLNPPDEAPIMRPVLILVPSSAIESYERDINLLSKEIKGTGFSLTLKLWFGKEGDTKHIGPEPECLLNSLLALNRKSLHTATTVVLTTYSTFRSRVQTAILKTVVAEYKQTLAATEGDYDPTRYPAHIAKFVDFAESDDQERPSSLIHGLRLLCGLFIGDEAHALKNATSGISILIQEMLSKNSEAALPSLLLTATPMINRPADLYGFLKLWWHESLTAEWTANRQIIVPEEYEQGLNKVREMNLKLNQSTFDRLTEVSLDVCNGFLQPTSYKYYASPATDPFEMSPKHGAQMLPTILGICQLKRVTGEKMPVSDTETITVGALIPPYYPRFLELKASVLVLDNYLAQHQRLMSHLSEEEDGDTVPSRKGPIGTGAIQRLTHASYDSRLAAFTANVASAASDMTALHSEFKNDSAAVYIAATSYAQDPSYDHPLKNAQYMATFSPKLSALAAIVEEVVIKHEEKMVVFLNNPLNLWKTEAFFQTVGIETLTLRAGHDADIRADVAASFREPHDKHKLLLTVIGIGGLSWNLQDACRNVCFVDVPSSVNVILQAIHRVRRMGQTKAVNAYFLYLDHTIDARLLHSAVSKHQGEVGGSIGCLSSIPDADEVSHRSAEIVQRMLGLRSDRSAIAWKSTNPYDKDELPVELEYRAAFLKAKGLDDVGLWDRNEAKPGTLDFARKFFL